MRHRDDQFDGEGVFDDPEGTMNKHRGFSVVPFLIVLAIVAVVCIGAMARHPVSTDHGPKSVVWQHSVDDGFDVAEAQSKHLLVLFTADWCPPCQRLKQDVLSRDDVMEQLQRDYVLVKIDLSDREGPNNAVAGEHGVQSIPKFIAYDRSGYHRGTTSGALTAKELLAWTREAAQ